MMFRVPLTLWVLLGTVGFCLSLVLLLPLLDGSFHQSKPYELWLGAGGLGLVFIWCFLRPRFGLRFSSREDQALQAKMDRRRQDGAPALDSEVLRRDREASRQKSREVRRGPRWLRPPMARRYGIKDPED